MSQHNLPELPEAIGVLAARRLDPPGTTEFYGYFNEGFGSEYKEAIYTASQMHAYALAALSEQGAGEAVAGKWDGAEEWMPLAWELCADECGEESCTELVWEGGPIPEPWGDRWLKYEDEAKRLIALVRKHTRPQAAQPARAVDVAAPTPSQQADHSPDGGNMVGQQAGEVTELRAALWHIKNTAIALSDAQVIALEALAAYEAKKAGQQ